jgi:uncharacterized phiE125 gp8 family phage protein
VRVNWTRTVDPVLDPLTLSEAKAQARLTHDDENTLLRSFVRAATDEAERYLGFGLLTQTIRVTGDEWPERIWLPQALVLQSVTSVEYYDTAGTLQTLATSQYVADDTTRPASIVRAANVSWPALQSTRDAWRWRVTYVVGWTTAAQIPAGIKLGLAMYVTHLDENRSGTETDADLARRAAENKWADRVSLPAYRAGGD